MNLFEKLEEKVKEWRDNNYICENYSQIREILNFNKITDNNNNISFRYLRKPQFETIETYLYLRFVLKTPNIIDLYKNLFKDNKTDFFKSIGINHLPSDALRYINIDEILKEIKENIALDDGKNIVQKHNYQTLHEALNLNYASYILALAMGTGKTILIGSIIAIEFAIAIDLDNQESDVKLMKNTLIFAPGKTIIESLREISDIDFEKILPARLFKKLAPNLKINYTKDKDKRFDGVIENSYFNILVTNSEKIILKSQKVKNDIFNQKSEDRELSENLRLQKICSLDNLGVFSDEAHNTYGNNIDKDLKRVRQTINHINHKKKLICVINTTGTPYYKKQPLKEVVFWYSLSQGIKDNILKSVNNNILSYDINDQDEENIIFDIINDFFKNYKDIITIDNCSSKIAFYFKNEDHLQKCKLLIEKSLIKLNLSITILLTNTQKSSKKELEDFNNLNSPDSQKRIILLIDKGKEGWNCPSLFATALIREVSSSNNFILQASTRCLRQVQDNQEKAKIYLSKKNVNILDKELKENFNISIGDLDNLDNLKIKTEISFVRKYQMPKLEITKELKKIVRDDIDINNINLQKPKKEADIVNFKTIYRFEDGELKESSFAQKIEKENSYIGLYNTSSQISTRYNIAIKDIIEKLKNIYPEMILPKNHLKSLFEQIEKQTNKYKISIEKIKEALAIIKIQDEDGNYNFQQDKNGVFYHKIRFKEGSLKEKLLYKFDDQSKKHDLGFHLSIYDFDSNPEKSFFTKLINILSLDKKEIDDIYFTGSINDTKKTDIYFEYKGIDGKYHNYFPDFIITKKNGEFLIVEIKASNKENDEEVRIKRKAVEYLEGIEGNKFKYIIIYADNDLIDDNNKNLLEVKKYLRK
tara:strand:- start:2453 stop:5074 length:2622 start_codon:yes stop_codon:yes gene_type:complete